MSLEQRASPATGANWSALLAAQTGVSFATNSDCEVPLHLWLREGPDYAKRLRGMYGIAIHERVRRTVTLSRDPFGIKPLYIASIDGGLAFAVAPLATPHAAIAASRAGAPDGGVYETAAASTALAETIARVIAHSGGGALLVRFMGEDAEGGEIVLDLLEGGEGGLAVVGGLLVVETLGLE